MTDLATGDLIFRQAEQLHEDGAFDQAGARYRDALKIFESLGEAERFGTCLQRLKSSTIAWLNRELQSRPDNADLHAALGRLYDDEKRFVEAERHFRSALRLNSASREGRDIRMALVGVLLRGGNEREAIDLCQACLTLDPDDFEAQYQSAVAHDRLEDFAAAEHHAMQAARVRPENDDAFHLLGHIRLEQRRFADAVAAFDTCYAIRKARDGLPQRQRAAIAQGMPAVAFIAQQRSASEYIQDVLAGALGLQIYYPNLGTSPRDYLIGEALALFAAGGSIARLHSDAHPDILNMLKAAGIKRLIVHFRDPRQSALSWAHHLARLPADEFRHFRHYHDPVFPADFQDWPFARRIVWVETYFYPLAVDWIVTWVRCEDALKRDFAVLFTEFSAFAAEPADCLGNIARFVGVDLATGDLLARFPREQSRNFRKGEVNEWRDQIDAAMQARMWALIPGDVANRFGWTR